MLENSKIKLLKEFGPGLVTGAADDDPSGVATYTIAGAQLGYKFLWTALLTWPLMAAVQMMCAHIALASQESLTKSFFRKFPRIVVFILVIALLVANTLNVAADLSAMADALELLTNHDSVFYVIILGALITLAMIFLNYAQIARTLTWMTFFLLSYVFTALHTDTDLSLMFHHTFVPSWPASQLEWSTLVALLGTTISPYLFFWQSSQEVEELQKNEDLNKTFDFQKTRKIRKWDIVIGTLVSNLVMYFIILTAANSLHANNITDIQTSKQAAQALEPLLGPRAVLFYTVGLLGVGLLAIPTLVGSASLAMADVFQWKSGLNKKLHQAKSFYAFLTVSMIIAVAINFVDVNPIKALFYSSIVNGLLSPILIIACLFVARDRTLMKGKMLGKISLTLILLTAVLMTLAAFGMFYFG